MVSLLLLFACAASPDPMLGRWVVAFYETHEPETDTGGPTASRDSGAPAEAVSEDCQDDEGTENFRGWLEIETADPVTGQHVVVHAGVDRPLTSHGVVPSGGMSGPLRGGFLDGEIQVHLLPDPNSPLAGASDTARWEEGHIVLRSAGWSRECHEVRWDWVETSGAIKLDQGGRAFLRRE